MKSNALIYCCIVVICFGCKSYKTKYLYSLDDFRPELRANLEVLLNEGYIGDNNEIAYSYLNDKTSKTELLKIFKSEHPLLRGLAYRVLSRKNLIDSGQLLIQNLNDSAKILYGDHYGEYHESLSDFYIHQSRMKTNIESEKLFYIIAEKNPSLRYLAILPEHFKKRDSSIYKIIKTQFIRTETNNNYKLRLGSILAEFKRNEDTTKLGELILLNRRFLFDDKERFYLMLDIIKEFPADCFLGKIEKYLPEYKHWKDRFYSGKKIGEGHNEIIFSLIHFKSKKAAKLIDEIINNDFFNDTYITKEEFVYEFHKKLTENNCEAFESIIKKYENIAKAFEKKHIIRIPPMESDIIDDLVIKRNPNHW